MGSFSAPLNLREHESAGQPSLLEASTDVTSTVSYLCPGNTAQFHLGRHL